MSHVLEKEDKRDQLLVDNDLQVTWKLTCGAIAGATAQTGKQSHYTTPTKRGSILIGIASPLAHVPSPLLFHSSSFYIKLKSMHRVNGRGWMWGKHLFPHTKYVCPKPEKA